MEGRTDGAQDSHCKVEEEEEDQKEKATTPRGNTQNTQKKTEIPSTDHEYDAAVCQHLIPSWTEALDILETTHTHNRLISISISHRDVAWHVCTCAFVCDGKVKMGKEWEKTMLARESTPRDHPHLFRIFYLRTAEINLLLLLINQSTLHCFSIDGRKDELHCAMRRKSSHRPAAFISR